MTGIQDSKKLRTIELILVVAVAFTGPVFSSVYALLSPTALANPDSTGVLVFYGIINELLAVSVMSYVCFRQGKEFRQLGLGFNWKDIPISILLFVITSIGFYLFYFLIALVHR